VRTVYQAALVAILSITMSGIPMASAAATPPSAPLGMVLQANRNNGDIDVSAQGETIYDGETLTTDGSKTLRVQLSGPQMFMRSNSIAEVHKLANGFSANLASGSVVVTTSEGQTFQMMADGATIQPVGTAPVTAQITMLTPKELQLTSTRGTLEVTMGNEVKTIEAGNSYRLEVEPADPADPADPQRGPAAGGSNHFALYLIVAVSAATAVGVWRVLVSPSGL
jgi:hypothetical protein